MFILDSYVVYQNMFIKYQLFLLLCLFFCFSKIKS